MQVDFLTLLVLGLAAYRVTLMLSIEDGPGDIFYNLKVLAGAKKSMNGIWSADTFFGKLLICFYCTSVWTALLLYCLWVFLPIVQPLIGILAVSGLACILYGLSDRH